MTSVLLKRGIWTEAQREEGGCAATQGKDGCVTGMMQLPAKNTKDCWQLPEKMAEAGRIPPELAESVALLIL